MLLIRFPGFATSREFFFLAVAFLFVALAGKIFADPTLSVIGASNRAAMIPSPADKNSTNTSGPTYATWAASYGLTGKSAQQNAVLEPDGLSNLSKYALGLNPCTIYNPATAGLPSVNFSKDRKYLTLSFEGVATDVTYTIQASNDARNWVTIEQFLSGNKAPGSVTVQDTQEVGSKKMRFMRLQMTSP